MALLLAETGDLSLKTSICVSLEKLLKNLQKWTNSEEL